MVLMRSCSKAATIVYLFKSSNKTNALMLQHEHVCQQQQKPAPNGLDELHTCTTWKPTHYENFIALCTLLHATHNSIKHHTLLRTWLCVHSSIGGLESKAYSCCLPTMYALRTAIVMHGNVTCVLPQQQLNSSMLCHGVPLPPPSPQRLCQRCASH
jgi:hypothetical protein